MNEVKSLADAMRDRARFLSDKSDSFLEYGWGDAKTVQSVLLEMADVIDSWSGEYLSKELTYQEDQRRRWSTTHLSSQKPMTMEERIAAVRKN